MCDLNKQADFLFKKRTYLTVISLSFLMKCFSGFLLFCFVLFYNLTRGIYELRSMKLIFMILFLTTAPALTPMYTICICYLFLLIRKGSVYPFLQGFLLLPLPLPHVTGSMLSH